MGERGIVLEGLGGEHRANEEGGRPPCTNNLDYSVIYVAYRSQDYRDSRWEGWLELSGQGRALNSRLRSWT